MMVGFSIGRVMRKNFLHHVGTIDVRRLIHSGRNTLNASSRITEQSPDSSRCS